MQTLRLRPGVNAELTPSLVEAGIAESRLIRFRAGLPEKLGGWRRFYNNAVGGVPKALHAWLDLNEVKRLAVGSTEILGAISGTQGSRVLTDLTPQTRASGLDSGNDRFTKVLLHFDGADASTTITDSNRGGSAHTWTAAGNAQIDTAQSKFGGASGLFDGTGDWITTPDSADFALGAGDWTVDLWFNCNAAGGTVERLAGQCDSTPTDASSSFRILRTAGNLIAASTQVGSTSFAVTGTTQFTNAVNTGWHHMAFVRTGDILRLFIDGVQEGGDVAITGTVNDSSNALRVGTTGEVTTDPWTGWIDEFRLSVGVARWTENFTPPSVGYYAPTFSTTNLSPNVVIEDLTLSGAITEFDSVEFKTPISVGGLILSGVYPVALTLGANTFRIVAGANATATVNDGGAVPVFDSTSGTAAIAVTLEDHALSLGGKINFPISTTVGGVPVFGTYAATAVGSVDEFTIAGATLAGSTETVAMNDGEPYLVYHIAIGPVPAATGYSIGAYSEGTYSIGAAVAAQTGDPIDAPDWSLDNWGEILLANPEGMGLYQWQPNTGLQNARLISGNGAPSQCTAAFVSMQTQMLIALGATDAIGIGNDRDPLLVKWTDTGDFTDFQPGVASLAGSRRLSTGSQIVGGMASTNQELIWTDLGLWAMSFLGSLAAGVWGFNEIGFNCGLMGKHARVRLGSNVYWMGQSNFFVLTGSGVAVIPCTVWDAVFQDINREIDAEYLAATGVERPYAAKSFAWANTPFNEVFFFFPRASTGATEPDYYVKLNVAEGWDHGPLARSAGIDQSIVGMPISASPAGVIYEHETARDDDGQPITAYIESGWFPIAEGEYKVFLDWVLPDMKWSERGGSENANVTIQFYSRDYPGDEDGERTYGPFTVTKATKFISPRLRGRLAKIRVGSSDVGSFWRLGAIRYRAAPDGKN
jgi:hypothetical protein